MTLSNGNVGIGTTAPGALLDVSGNRLGSPSLTGAYIGHAGPTFTDSSTTASGTATNMAFHAVASPTLAASNTGVTTTNAFTTYIAGAPKKGTNNTATNAVALGIGGTALAGHVNSYGLLVNAQTGATNNYSAIFQGGNVGIGSAAPTQRLDVAGAIRSSSGGFVFPDGTVMTTAITPTSGGTSSTTDLNLAADTEATGNGAIIVSTGTIERMRISNSGNIGIGTTVPASALDLQSGDWSSGQLRIGSTSQGGRILFRRAGDGAATGSVGWSGASESNNFNFSSTSGGGYFTWSTNNGAVTEKMRLSASGSLGIGTTSPVYKLDVVGDINTTTCVRIAGTQQLGTCASDERFKKNIQPIQSALAKLRLLNPVHYEFRTEEFPERHFSHSIEAGLIAQDLERVFPDLVVTGDDGYKRVKYGLDLEMQTIAAVKELALENDHLKAEALILKERADRAEAEAQTLRVTAAELKVESAELRAFLCQQFPAAPLCGK
jgi:hypothetical protein